MKHPRIFSGVYPEGIVYSDRQRNKHGDYYPLAFLPYSTLRLEVEPDCPPELLSIIRADVAQYKPGQEFQLSTSGQTVTLGYISEHSAEQTILKRCRETGSGRWVMRELPNPQTPPCERCAVIDLKTDRYISTGSTWSEVLTKLTSLGTKESNND